MAERDNQNWLRDLRSTGSAQELALDDLRKIVERGLSHALTRYLKPDDPHFQTLVEESAQETLLKVLDRLDTFEGRSKFTTWVYKIAIRVALTELRRKRWQNISLDEMTENYDHEIPIPAGQVHAENRIQQIEMIERVNDIIQNELSEKQRAALIALGGDMPLEEIARRMGSNRNALYKLLHDARKKLKQRLALEGLQVDEVLAAYDEPMV